MYLTPQVAEVSFNFWFQLAERIYRATDVAILDTYKPVFLELLNVIVSGTVTVNVL